MNETYRKISIVLEIDRAVKYLRLGLGEIQKVSATNDFYDPVFLYLSGGLERLFKSMLCLAFQEREGRLPNPNDIWDNRMGHDLVFLKENVEKICIPVTKPFASEDYEIITQNKFINRVCETLAGFAKRGRYFNLDAVLGVAQDFDAKKAWDRIEMTVSKELFGEKEYYALLSDPKQLDGIYSESNREIIIRLEKFFRALTRQFIFGNFSSKSQTFIFQVDTFSDIEDYQLGMTDYLEYQIHEQIKRKN